MQEAGAPGRSRDPGSGGGARGRGLDEAEPCLGRDRRPGFLPGVWRLPGCVPESSSSSQSKWLGGSTGEN